MLSTLLFLLIVLVLLAGAVVWWLWLRPKAALQVELDQRYCRYGTPFSGALLLRSSQPLAGVEMSLELVGEARCVEFLGGRREIEVIELYRNALRLQEVRRSHAGLQVAAFESILPVLEREGREASLEPVAGLKSYQYERAQWFLEAAASIDGQVVTERVALQFVQRE